MRSMHAANKLLEQAPMPRLSMAWSLRAARQGRAHGECSTQGARSRGTQLQGQAEAQPTCVER